MCGFPPVLLVLVSLPLTAQPATQDLSAAQKLLRSGDAAGAGAAAVKLLAESPNSAESHEFAGEVEFRQGEMERAEAEFRKAIQLEPKFGRAWWGLARVFDCSSLHGVRAGFSPAPTSSLRTIAIFCGPMQAR